MRHPRFIDRLHDSLRNRFRSHDTIEMVRIEKDRLTGKEQVIRAHLPTGKGWNDGSGVIFWKNMGWIVAEEYEARVHATEMEAKRLEAVKAAEKAPKKEAAK